MNKLFCLAMGLLVAVSSFGSLLVNGDMSDGSVVESGNSNLDYDEIGLGWISTQDAGPTYSIAGGVLRASSENNDAISQINAVTTETGSQLLFRFDYTPDALAGTVSQLKLHYQLVGWHAGTGTLADGDILFDLINGDNNNASVIGVGGTWVDLLDGTVQSATTAASEEYVIGEAGLLSEFSRTIDLSTYGAGHDDVADYDYIGVRFHLAEAEGNQLDNVSLVAIPEPATLGLISLFGSCLLFLRRNKS